MTKTVKFDHARLLNENCPVSSGGETLTAARLDGKLVAEIQMNQDTIGQSYTEYRVVGYEVEWMDGRDDEGRSFEVKRGLRWTPGTYTTARDALTAARNYVRENA